LQGDWKPMKFFLGRLTTVAECCKPISEMSHTDVARDTTCIKTARRNTQIF
jgi:hypothetical protein